MKDKDYQLFADELADLCNKHKIRIGYSEDGFILGSENKKMHFCVGIPKTVIAGSDVKLISATEIEV
jgi:hypothetical protein